MTWPRVPPADSKALTLTNLPCRLLPPGHRAQQPHSDPREGHRGYTCVAGPVTCNSPARSHTEHKQLSRVRTQACVLAKPALGHLGHLGHLGQGPGSLPPGLFLSLSLFSPSLPGC